MRFKSCLAVLLALPMTAMAGFQISDGTAIDNDVDMSARSGEARQARPADGKGAFEVEMVGAKASTSAADSASLSPSGAILFKNFKSRSARFAQGMGRDVALGLAVSQIAQSNDWEIKAEPMVNMKKAVNWNGGFPWTEVLDDVLSQAGYSAEIDGVAKTVSIYARTTPIENRVWELDSKDGSLRRTLTKWAAAAGWQLVWEAPYDFPVSMYARLEGSFEDAVVAVSKSLKSSENPVRVVFYEGNRVVRVVPADGGKSR